MRSRLHLAAACVLVALGGCSGPSNNTSAPPAGPVVEPPISGNVPSAKITRSSMLENFDAAGLLRATEPGWHAARNPTYPQWVQIEFDEPRMMHQVSLLPQDTYAVRGPKQVDVEGSEDGRTWKDVVSILDACAGGENTWRVFP